MTFTPFKNQIEIEIVQKTGPLSTPDDKQLLEVGKVVAVGEGVTFFKVGDWAHFESFGCSKTADLDGKEHYVVLVNEHVIRGKHTSE
jgi:co-chaperonin GroES (HSP10)